MAFQFRIKIPQKLNRELIGQGDIFMIFFWVKPTNLNKIRIEFGCGYRRFNKHTECF